MNVTQTIPQNASSPAARSQIQEVRSTAFTRLVTSVSRVLRCTHTPTAPQGHAPGSRDARPVQNTSRQPRLVTQGRPSAEHTPQHPCGSGNSLVRNPPGVAPQWQQKHTGTDQPDQKHKPAVAEGLSQETQSRRGTPQAGIQSSADVQAEEVARRLPRLESEFAQSCYTEKALKASLVAAQNQLTLLRQRKDQIEKNLLLKTNNASDHSKTPMELAVQLMQVQVSVHERPEEAQKTIQMLTRELEQAERSLICTRESRDQLQENLASLLETRRETEERYKRLLTEINDQQQIQASLGKELLQLPAAFPQVIEAVRLSKRQGK